MDELIRKQDAIDATWKEPSYTDPLNVLTEVRERIEQLPSAQPEIVRCKDCKHYVDGYIHCNRVTWWNGEDDFCSRAERRIDDRPD